MEIDSISAGLANEGHCPTGIHITPSPNDVNCMSHNITHKTNPLTIVWHGVIFIHKGTLHPPKHTILEMVF
jgi:hypothetical protein